MAKSIPTEQISCKNCPFWDNSKWLSLDDDDVELLNSTKICKVYEPGEAVFFDGDKCNGIHCVRSGIVAIKRYYSGTGQYVLGRLMYPGSTLGYRAMTADDNYRGSAEVVETCSTCFIDKNTVKSLLERSPMLRFKFLQNAAMDLGNAEMDLFLQATHSIQTRLARILMMFEERSARIAKDGSRSFKLPFNRSDLAAMIGAHPESVRRTIRSFETEDIAYFKGRTVSIPDSDKLSNLLNRHFSTA